MPAAGVLIPSPRHCGRWGGGRRAAAPTRHCHPAAPHAVPPTHTRHSTLPCWPQTARAPPSAPAAALHGASALHLPPSHAASEHGADCTHLTPRCRCTAGCWPPQAHNSAPPRGAHSTACSILPCRTQSLHGAWHVQPNVRHAATKPTWSVHRAHSKWHTASGAAGSAAKHQKGLRGCHAGLRPQSRPREPAHKLDTRCRPNPTGWGQSKSSQALESPALP